MPETRIQKFVVRCASITCRDGDMVDYQLSSAFDQGSEQGKRWGALEGKMVLTRISDSDDGGTRLTPGKKYTLEVITNE